METSPILLKWGARCGIAIMLGITLAFVSAPAQSASSSQQSTRAVPRPVPLRHLYWHFLIYQHIVDAKAAQEEAKGLDGTLLRDRLQHMLGFSDTDYAPIRTASTQLYSDLQTLNSQAASIRAAGSSSSADAQLKGLVAQREAYISAEILVLKESLPPDKITALEAFMTQFFAPKKLTFQVTPH